MANEENWRCSWATFSPRNHILTLVTTPQALPCISCRTRSPAHARTQAAGTTRHTQSHCSSVRLRPNTVRCSKRSFERSERSGTKANWINNSRAPTTTIQCCKCVGMTALPYTQGQSSSQVHTPPCYHLLRVPLVRAHRPPTVYISFPLVPVQAHFFGRTFLANQSSFAMLPGGE